MTILDICKLGKTVNTTVYCGRTLAQSEVSIRLGAKCIGCIVAKRGVGIANND